MVATQPEINVVRAPTITDLYMRHGKGGDALAPAVKLRLWPALTVAALGTTIPPRESPATGLKRREPI
jgi:hypothetical protein